MKHNPKNRVSIHEFAHRALRFISWVDLFYHRVQSAVNVNGHLSSFFGLSHGIRQGCPLLLLHYALVSEVLVVNIHCNPHIPGLCLVSVFFCLLLSPISQYADDTSLILTSDDGSFSVSHDALVYGTSSAHVSSSMSVSSTKACYLFLLSENMVSPHCLEKYAEVYGALDWPAT